MTLLTSGHSPASLASAASTSAPRPQAPAHLSRLSRTRHGARMPPSAAAPAGDRTKDPRGGFLRPSALLERARGAREVARRSSSAAAACGAESRRSAWPERERDEAKWRRTQAQARDRDASNAADQGGRSVIRYYKDRYHIIIKLYFYIYVLCVCIRIVKDAFTIYAM